MESIVKRRKLYLQNADLVVGQGSCENIIEGPTKNAGKALSSHAEIDLVTSLRTQVF